MLKPQKTQNSIVPHLIVVFIFLSTIFVFSGALKNSFLNWDDDFQTYENTANRNISSQSLFKMLIALHPVLRIWQPLPRLSYSLDYQLYGLAPWGYHLTNILIHAANACLVFGVFYLLVASSRPKLAAKPVLYFSGTLMALIFAIHPLRVEPVSWVSSRDELLCALFFLAALLTYILYGRSSATIRRYSLLSVAWLFFLFALMSKAMAISLPIVLLLLDAFPFNRIRNLRTFSSCIVEKIPFFVLSGFSGIITLTTRSSGNLPQSILELNIFTSLWEGFQALLFHQKALETQTIGFAQRAVLSVQNIWFYVEKTLWPKELLPYYSMPENLTLSSGTFWFSLAFTFIITAICIRQFKRGNPLWALIWGYYIVTIFPVLGFVYSGYRGPSSDRYTYISTLSFYFLIGLAVLWLWENKFSPLRTRLYKIGLFVSSFILVCTLTILTFQQIKIWKDGESFWFYLLEHQPRNTLVLTSLGNHYWEKGQTENAMLNYQKALHINPDLYTTRNDLGLLYSSLQPKKAEREFKAVLEQAPEYHPAYNNLGLLYMAQGKMELAEQSFLETLRIKPGYARGHNNLGLIYLKKKLLNKAEKEFFSALENQPDFADAHNNLGLIYMARGKKKEAENKFEEALALNPNFKAAFGNLLKLHEKYKM